MRAQNKTPAANSRFFCTLKRLSPAPPIHYRCLLRIFTLLGAKRTGYTQNIPKLLWFGSFHSNQSPLQMSTVTSALAALPVSALVKRYKLGVQYNGSPFRGWQMQAGHSFASWPYRTVQEVLNVRSVLFSTIRGNFTLYSVNLLHFVR